jgi:hypothetical protein
MHPPSRASDRDRKRAVAALKKGYLTGRLSTQTFEERVAVAQAARSRGALRAVLADLDARWIPTRDVIRPESSKPVPSSLWATLVLSRCERAFIVVGRSSSCDVVFGDPDVSRRHATFERVGRQWCVNDLDSANGTFVDDVRVMRAPVGVGSKVRLGSSFLDIA